MATRYHVGTSGWHYPHWRGAFYPPRLPATRWLEYYARHFDTVEINRSFYRLPSVAAARAWRAGTPRGFVFALKASRYITHMKKLREPRASLRAFVAVARALGAKRGPLLFQLPPHWGCDPARLAAFLERLPRGLACAFELRDPSWHNREVYDLLARHNAAFCLYDLAGFATPCVLTADFAYLRLHGPAGAYTGRYDAAQLADWARRIRSWKRLRAAYVYFDNDAAAHAAHNALALRALLD
jgi:uncharacterized protein YecE (DUF72 family)